MFNSQIYAGLLFLPILATNLLNCGYFSTPFSPSIRGEKHDPYLSCSPVVNHNQISSHQYATSSKYLQASWATTVYSLSHTRFQLEPKKNSVFMYIAILLIIRSHDTELNPGPRNYKPKFPCGACHKAVRWSKTRTAVACDNCNTWYHTDCMGMSSESYDRVNKSNITWICGECDAPNHSLSLLDSYLNESDNKFSPLSSDSLTSSSTRTRSDSSQASLDSNIHPGSPVHQSSPTRKNTGRRKNEPKPLKVLTANLQSLPAKREAFWEAVNSCQPDIIIANETWLKPSILNSEIMPPGFNTPIRKDRADGYGGVLLATRKDIIDCEIKIDSTCELIASKIQVYGQRTLIVISAYRPPKNDVAYAQNMCQAIKVIIASNPSAVVWIGGDFNLPDINWSMGAFESHQYTNAINNHFLSTFSDAGLTQIVDFPTRGKKTLDLFFTNRPSLTSRCVPTPGVGDHDMVLTLSETRARRQKPVRHKIFLWKKADMSRIRSEISAFGTLFTEENSISTDVDTLWMQLKSELHRVLDTLVPSKFTSTRFSQPWINSNIKALSRRKNRAYKKAHRSKKTKDWSRYKNIKKSMQRECRSTYHTYISDMLSNEGGKPKRFWSYIKNTRCDSTGVAPLLKDGTLQCEASAKANLLNEQFASVFTDETLSNLPDLGDSHHPIVPEFSVDKEGVRKLLAKIKPHTASGPDNLPAYLLKEVADELAPILCLLFNATLHQGKIPQDWKSAYITPILKKGDKHKPENYRPISLTSIICKTAEHIIHSQIMRHLDTHSLLTECQFGFRRRRSCESQLLITVQDLAAGLRDKQQIDAILLDFSKAFDRVPHERLLLKLQHYGIRGQLLSWVRDFLKGRTQQVALEGVKSITKSVSSGVPQGTVLGPLLFLVFINDLPDCVSSSIRLYADDALLYRSIKTQDDTEALHQDLTNIQEWERKWLMPFNTEKCEVLRISSKRKNIIASIPYSIHGTALRTVDEAKYLGVTIHRTLKWKSHVNNICKRSNSTLGFLRRNLRKCPPRIKEQAYKTYVRPTLEYSSTVWDPHTIELTTQIEMVQRRAARFVTSDYGQQSSVTTMLQKLKWQTLSERRAHSKVIMLYRIMNGLVAIPAAQPYLYPSSGRTRGHHLQLRQHNCRISVYQHSYFPSVVCLWNVLPSTAVSAPSIEVFKSRLSSVTFH